MNKAIWNCKIGEVNRKKLPQDSDVPMRKVVREAYLKLTGEEPVFVFSGWGGELTPEERDVV
jgi:hypothetical protein